MENNKVQKAPIANYSSEIIKFSYKKIRSPKNNRYIAIPELLSGDAPKDLLHIYEKGRSRVSNKRTWIPYICKVGHKWYPSESITEQLVTRLGRIWGFNMANSNLYVINGQIRFCSEVFLNKDQELVHGADILSRYLQEKDTQLIELIDRSGWSQELLTFQIIKTAIKDYFPVQAPQIIRNLVRMLIFDAVVGNNDRHFFNWGIVRHLKNYHIPYFSPIYDTARALFWNWPYQKILRLTNSRELYTREISKYSNEAKPKIGWSGFRELNHFTMVANLVMENECSFEEANSLFSVDNLEKARIVLDEEFSGLIFNTRRKLILDYLSLRFEEFNNILN